MAEMNEHELTDEERQQLELVTGNPEMLAGIVGDLSGASRRKRQTAAHVVAIVAEYRPEALDAHVPELLDALARPEAQTRWEILNALAMLVSTHAKEIGSVYEDAEDALFDEDSATLRLAAFRLLAVWGGTERRRSEKVWPILEEAIRCYPRARSMARWPPSWPDAWRSTPRAVRAPISVRARPRSTRCSSSASSSRSPSRAHA